MIFLLVAAEDPEHVAEGGDAVGKIFSPHGMGGIIEADDDGVGAAGGELGKRPDRLSEKVLPGIVEDLGQLEMPFLDAEIDDLAEVAGAQEGDGAAVGFGEVAADAGALPSGLVIELHGEVEELIREASLLGNALGRQEIVPASGMMLADVKRAALDHFAQQLVGKLDAAPKLACRHAVVQPRRLLDMLEQFQLEEIVFF